MYLLLNCKLFSIPFSEEETQQLLGICTKYLFGLAMDTRRKEIQKSIEADQVLRHTFNLLRCKDHRFCCVNCVLTPKM